MGLFEKIFPDFFGHKGPERRKKRQLRHIRKDLKKHKRFFHVKSNKIQPGMAMWFYNIYKTIGPAQFILKKYKHSKILKTVLIESFFPEELKSLAVGLQPEKIEQRADKTDNVKVVSKKIEEELLQIYSALDPGTVKRVNKLYNDFQHFQNFLNFDYYFLLKKFDPGIPEQDFVYKPRFAAVDATNLAGMLMDFLEVYHALDDEAEWNLLFDVLKSYRNLNLISKSTWKKILQGRREIFRSGILELMIRYLEKNPSWGLVSTETHYEIVREYLNNLKLTAESAVARIQQGRRKKRIESLLMNIFGTTKVNQTLHYTKRESLVYEKKMLPGYTLVEPINYLKIFLVGYYKGKVRALVDLLLIHGMWISKSGSREFSESYHALLDQLNSLLAFDASLANGGPAETRLKRLLRSAARENFAKGRSAMTSLKTVLNEINEEAHQIIKSSEQYLKIFTTDIKQLLEEYRLRGNEQIANWKNVESQIEEPVEKQMFEVYKHLHNMTLLLQCYTKDETAPDTDQRSREQELQVPVQEELR